MKKGSLLEKYIKEMPLDTPSSDFTESIEHIIATDSKIAFNEDSSLNNVLKRAAKDTLPIHFSEIVTTKIQQTKEQMTILPLISFKAAMYTFFVIVIVLFVLLFVLLIDNQPTIDISTVQKIQKPSWMSWEQIPSVLPLSCIALSSLLIIDRFLQKKTMIY